MTNDNELQHVKLWYLERCGYGEVNKLVKCIENDVLEQSAW